MVVLCRSLLKLSEDEGMGQYLRRREDPGAFSVSTAVFLQEGLG